MGWRIPINFQTLHYAYIIACSLLGLLVLAPYGNLSGVDAFFFGASGSTESGLNTVDVKDLKTYQQLYIYFVPIVTNLGFINIAVVVVRLYWFKKHLKEIAPSLLLGRPADGGHDLEVQTPHAEHDAEQQKKDKLRQGDIVTGNDACGPLTNDHSTEVDVTYNSQPRTTTIAFDENSKALYIPSPADREKGHPIVELNDANTRTSHDELHKVETPVAGPSTSHHASRISLQRVASSGRIAGVASSVFIIGATAPSQPSMQTHQPTHEHLPFLSSQVTVGRNSQFHGLTSKDREELGGIEYQSLKLLLKIIIAYFFGLHMLGALCLVAWTQVQSPDNKYMQWLRDCGQDKTWWAFYSAQTMVNNLGFTLTPDSMVTFRDAAFPMLVMSFLAFAGNTFYPIFLRWGIYVLSKLIPNTSSLQEPLAFLLKHPRRCYTLLFPSKPTWILFTILCVLNIVDVILIIALDLDNPAVNELTMGPRVLAAIFQAASSRHTGTATFNLGLVSPAVQFSLLVMMYISIFPIAISIRASNTYEEKALGMYQSNSEVDDSASGRSYFLRHLQNQLSFDLWYIFLGIFCICVAESDKVMDPDKPSFAVFPIFFEVVSAYCNVGLSLGDPSVYTSLCGLFSPFSKVVICLMMIRGRHRGLPYQLDRAIMLPSDQLRDAIEDGHDRLGNAEVIVKRDMKGRIASFKTV